MNEENYLRERMSKKNPFQVPEGYFEDFATQVMANLPAREQKMTVNHRALRPWMYAAACLLVAVFCVAFYFSRVQPESPEMSQMAVSESYMDEAADYAMIDNTDIYAYLAEN
jgi:hypothetical protein